MDSLIFTCSSCVFHLMPPEKHLPKFPEIKFYALRPRPANLPFGWVKIAEYSRYNYGHKRDWQLVLDSAGIEFRACHWHGLEFLYVSPLTSNIALSELQAFIQENKPAPRLSISWPLFAHSWLIFLFLLPLILIYLLDGSRFAASLLPASKTWFEAGCLSWTEVMLHGQWQRLATALCLHANSAHLAGNVAFGALFLILLARLCGSGAAALITIIGGIAANAISLVIHNPGYASVGFSTALFACAGATAGIMAVRAQDKRKLFLPLAAALGLLAVLGTTGENTDYAAHVAGVLCGCILGIGEGVRQKKNMPGLPQTLAGLLAFLIPCLAWIMAFNSFSF